MPSYEVDREKAAEHGLTQRELEVLLLAIEGLNSQEIGVQLGISDNTVRGYSSNLMTKLDAESPTQVGAKAVFRGIIKE